LSLGGLLAVVAVECAKILAQIKARLVMAACLVAPFAFAVAMRVQNALPTDTLFGRAVNESGFAVPLVVLGFAALWALPALTSVVGGDLFSAEDRHGTWTTVLTRSRSRAEIFVGKAVAALAFSAVAVVVLALSSVAAGVLVIGFGSLIDLSGVLLAPEQALPRVVLAWVSVLPPAFAFTALAVLLSVATRNSAAGIGLPVLIGLVMQLVAFVDMPEPVRRLFPTAAFNAWHGLLSEPAYYGPAIHGVIVSGVYLVACLGAAYQLLLRREIGR
jgi:ABC-2 type transport system permease protein